MTNVFNETIDTLTQAFQEYKDTNDQRIAAVENGRSVDVLIEEKLSRLDGFMNRQENLMRKSRFQPRVESAVASNHDGEAKSQFMAYMRHGDTRILEQKSLSTQDAEGGFLMPEVISSHIGETLTDLSVMRRLASVMTISSGSVDLLLDKTGAEVGWVGESDDRPETSAGDLHKMSISAHEVYAKVRATQRLLDDSHINVEQWIAQNVAHKMAAMENTSFINGDGIKKPKGILAYQSVSAENWTWGKIEEVALADAGQVNFDDLINLMGALKPNYLSGSSWLMSRSVLAQLRRIKSTDGYYIWQPSTDQSSSATVFGYQVEISDDMPALDADQPKASVIFGNFKLGYQIVDRTGVYTLRDPYSAKPYVEFYTTKRVGGDVINFEALKVLK